MAPKEEGQEDPDSTLAETFDDPNYNPFSAEDGSTIESSTASQQLRNNFIRLTTQQQQQQQPPTAAAATGEDHYNRYNMHHNYNASASASAALAVAPPHHHYYDYSNYNRDGYVVINNTTKGQSLRKAVTTPEALSILLPFACVFTHILFFYGQVEPMWKLSLTVEHVNVTATSKSVTAGALFNALNWDSPKNFYENMDHTVKEFTYGYAVHELWEAKGIAAAWLAKIAAIGLVVFSGIWPHLKLILLQYCWMKSTTNPNRRTKTLGWLALLGKWSLADVLTVCVMVGVLNLEWKLNPSHIKDGILNNLHILVDLASQVWSVSDVCTMALSFDAHDCNNAGSVKKDTLCFTCKRAVQAAFGNPDIAESTGKTIVKDVGVDGSGTIRLSVKGMKGIYYFCTAVILSVLLSVVVEWYNHLFLETLRDKEKQQQLEQQQQPGGGGGGQSHTLSLTEEGEGDIPAITSTLSSAVSSADDSDASEPLLLEDAPPRYEPMEIMDDNESVFNGFVQRTTSSSGYQWLQCQYIMPTITLLFVGFAVYLPSMERHVGGAIPDLLRDILEVHLDRTYSLATLRDTTGAAGGWDYLLMATFGLFCVMGPLIRAILVVIVAMTKPTDDTKRIRSLLVRASNFLAAFCAWEVFLVAMIMVELIMPQATQTIMNTHACHVLAKDGGSCLRVTYERVHTTFACLVLGFILIGGLSIHVSLEDKKERRRSEGGAGGGGELPPITTMTQGNQPGPPLEINTTPSYALVPSTSTTMTSANGGFQEDCNNSHVSDGSSLQVSTMIQEEVV